MYIYIYICVCVYIYRIYKNRPATWYEELVVYISLLVLRRPMGGIRALNLMLGTGLYTT